MKRTIKTILILLLFTVVFPALAGLAVMGLWNSIMPAVCGFSVITFWQSVGIFIMSQILSGGIVFAMFIIGGSIHHVTGHHHGELKSHWHDMTEQQRREFIERRRRERFGFHNRQNKRDNAPDGQYQ